MAAILAPPSGRVISFGAFAEHSSAILELFQEFGRYLRAVGNDPHSWRRTWRAMGRKNHCAILTEFNGGNETPWTLSRALAHSVNPDQPITASYKSSNDHSEPVTPAIIAGVGRSLPLLPFCRGRQQKLSLAMCIATAAFSVSAGLARRVVDWTPCPLPAAAGSSDTDYWRWRCAPALCGSMPNSCVHAGCTKQLSVGCRTQINAWLPFGHPDTAVTNGASWLAGRRTG